MDREGQIDPKEVQEAYRELRDALNAHAQAAIAKLRAEEALEEALAGASDRIFGRNREERNAKSRSLFANLYRQLAQAEENLILAKTRLEGAKSRVEEIRLLLEMKAGFPRKPLS